MKTTIRLGLPTLALALASTATSAQERIQELCHFAGDGTLYGYSVALSDLDGDGRPDLVIGAPGFTGLGQMFTGEVFFDSTFLKVAGDDVDDRFGAAVEGGLNLDGDAFGDVLAGAPGDDDNGAESGSVSGLSEDRLELFQLFGDAAGDEFGTSLAKIGDLDADGFTDFIVGAPQNLVGGAGYARVVSGLFATTLRTHVGGSAGDRFGQGVTGLPDLDGDGIHDYAVGAPGELGVGRVRVFSGVDGALLRVHDGAAPGDEFGWALGTGTDIDRDTIDELVVGAPRGGLAPGSAYAYAGSNGLELLAVTDTHAAGRFGASVNGAGDFDGDGFGDVVVGAPGTINPLGFPNDAGDGTIWSGATGAMLMRTGGGWSGSAVGTDVAAGDLDGDGLSEVVVGGMQNNDGYGATPCVVVFGRSTQERVRRGQADSLFGASVAAIGDLDGDGRREVAIGAPFFKNSQGVTVGSARVETVDGVLIHEFLGNASGDRHGGAVASAGDVDADGFDDILVASALRTGFVPGGPYVRVYSGQTGAMLHEFQIVGAAGFGTALAGGGDVDGDGHADVIIGGASFSSGQFGLAGFLSTGAVRVYSGLTGAVLYAVDGSAAEGASVAMLDDLDGDGCDDFAYGAPERFVGAPFFTLGEVEFHSGKTGALLGTYTDFYYRMGTALAAIDDVDGDGLGDVAVSSWDPQQLWSMGTVHTASTQTFATLSTTESQVSYQGLTYGYALSSIRDGSGALVVGTPGTNTNGARAVGSASLHSGPGSFGTLQGYSGWDYFGYSVAALGDVDGDGKVDVAIGAPTEVANGFGAQAGQNRVHIRLSNELYFQKHCPQAANSTGTFATLTAQGSSSLLQNELTLAATGLPPQKAGLFLIGSMPAALPYFSGYLCVTGQVGRVSSALAIGLDGTLETMVDLTVPPASFIDPGSSWSFQLLFRDLGTLNTSDAVRVQFVQ